MASAWGKSWGKAWGNSFGKVQTKVESIRLPLPLQADPLVRVEGNNLHNGLANALANEALGRFRPFLR